jgi:hypothetical protein
MFFFSCIPLRISILFTFIHLTCCLVFLIHSLIIPTSVPNLGLILALFSNYFLPFRMPCEFFFFDEDVESQT